MSIGHITVFIYADLPPLVKLTAIVLANKISMVCNKLPAQTQEELVALCSQTNMDMPVILRSLQFLQDKGILQQSSTGRWRDEEHLYEFRLKVAGV